MADEEDYSALEFFAPLSVVVLRYGPAADSEPFVKALQRTFLGVEPGRNFPASDYELVDPLDFRVFLCARSEDSPEPVRPGGKKDDIVAQSETTLVILLLTLDDETARRLVEEWSAFVQPREGILLLAVNLATPARPALDTLSAARGIALGLNDLNERDLRQDILSLHALNAALQLVGRMPSTRPAAGEAQRPVLFISHAKRDGVPLAVSLNRWLQDLLGFQFFYDTLNLDLQANISAQLEKAVAGSVLIVLRTEIFDQRYWCQKEIYWAEKHGVPVLAVDGRWSLQHAPSIIVFDSSPSVRIPDGSIIRILLAAMTEALRVGLFRARVRQTAERLGIPTSRWRAVPRFPSLGSLHSATEPWRAHSPHPTEAHYIFHPNPALPDELREVATDMAKARLSSCEVLSLDELRVLAASL